MSPQSLHVTTQLVVVAEADPQVPARILALVTCRNELPLEFRLKLSAETLTVEMVLPELTEDERRLLGDKVRRIPTVITADVSLVGWADVTRIPPGERLPA